MPVRVLDAQGLGDAGAIAAGIRYAATHWSAGDQPVAGVRLSVPATEIPDVLQAIRFARARGAVVVGAAGNEARPVLAYPARAPGMIAVGATTEHVCQANYSNYGLGLDVVAPGGGSDAPLPEDPVHCRPGDRSGRSIVQVDLHPRRGRFGLPDNYEGTSMAGTARVGGGRAGDRQRGDRPAALAGGGGDAPGAHRTRPGPAGLRPATAPGWSTPARRWRWRHRAPAEPRQAPARLRRADDQHRAGRVAGDLVGDRAQQEALGAGHALVADDVSLGVARLGDAPGIASAARPRGQGAGNFSTPASRTRRRRHERGASTSSRGFTIHSTSSGACDCSSRSRELGDRLVRTDQVTVPPSPGPAPWPWRIRLVGGPWTVCADHDRPEHLAPSAAARTAHHMRAPRARTGLDGQSLTIAITIPASTNTTIRTWVQSHTGDIALERVDSRRQSQSQTPDARPGDW